jgi:CRISPR/Cas system CSM-associated protein Csm3 (group 7 of RAMP superfamily)
MSANRDHSRSAQLQGGTLSASPFKPIVHLARITLETLGPLALATGRNGPLFDAGIVTDANGLPALPGTALAGALRHALRPRIGAAATRALFGGAERDGAVPSALGFTWGHIHDSRNRPVDGLDTERRWTGDPVLAAFAASELPYRDSLRLNHRGVATGGQRERSFVPPGHRFTFELALWDGPDEALAAPWETLKAVLAGPDFRLGGGTRRGFGHLRVQRFAEARFDLREAEDFARFSRHPRRLDRPAEALRETPIVPAEDRWLVLDLDLTGEEFWRFGGGGVPMTEGIKAADLLPYTEEWVVWIGSRGHPAGRRVVIPASAVKGALAHRTAYHYNRLTRRFGNVEAPDSLPPEPPESNPAVRHLFGHAQALPGRGETAGRVGGVLIDDVAVEGPRLARLTHNSLDRFTSGVRDGVYYLEEAAFGQAFRLRIRIDRTHWREADDPTRRAFRAAVEDLARGRLALGAGAAKGFGFFQGEILRDDLKGIQT